MMSQNENIFGTEGVVTVNEIEIILSRMGPKVSREECLGIIKSLVSCRMSHRHYEADVYDFFDNYIMKRDRYANWMANTGNEDIDPILVVRDIADWYADAPYKEWSTLTKKY